tara:strand:+ start:11996 stop:12940 length:945 start_codon:yes stop_codon:yes gene_type:complete
MPLNEKKNYSWLERLRKGLSRSSSQISDGIGDIIFGRKLDDGALEELEDLLIAADMGLPTASNLVANLSKDKFGKDVSPEEIKSILAANIAEILRPIAKNIHINEAAKPHVILVSGVNGTGKTTTIGKLAKQFKDNDLRVMLAAGDTFRAAAVEQLKIWGARTNSPVVANEEEGGDAAAVAFKAISLAQNENIDVLLVDTAGRLQNKAHLMEELSKIERVLSKIDSSAPHTRLLVLDATTGQNAHNQVEAFKSAIDIDSLVVTKLDGTAKGGVLVSLAQQFSIPVVSIGVGEAIDDLRPFDPKSFAETLMGVNI